jgi:hypothetical protein
MAYVLTWAEAMRGGCRSAITAAQHLRTLGGLAEHADASLLEVQGLQRTCGFDPYYDLTEFLRTMDPAALEAGHEEAERWAAVGPHSDAAHALSTELAAAFRDATLGTRPAALSGTLSGSVEHPSLTAEPSELAHRVETRLRERMINLSFSGELEPVAFSVEPSP